MRRDTPEYWRRVREVAAQDEPFTEEELTELSALIQPSIAELARGIADDLGALNERMRRGEAA